MKHIIEELEISINWEQVELTEVHDSGCKEWAVEGEGSNGKTYQGNATYQDDELIEVIHIEEI